MRFLVLLVALCFTASAQTILNITLKSAPEVETIRNAVEMYMEQNPDVLIEVNALGRDGYDQRLTTQLLAGSDTIDIFNVTNLVLGQLAASGVVEPLDSYVNQDTLNASGFSIDNFLPSALTMARYNDELYGLPYIMSTLLLYYREDLISKPPETWEEYLELAAQLTQENNPTAITQYGTTLQGKRGSTSVSEWSAFLWSHGGDYTIDGQIALESQGAQEALSTYGELYKRGIVPPDATAYEYGETLEAFQSGLTAMAIQWDAAAGTFANPEASPDIADKFAAAVVPGVRGENGEVTQVPYLQAWVLSINAFSQNKEEAYAFLSFLNDPEVFSQAAIANQSTALFPVLESGSIEANYGVAFDAYKQSLELGRALPTGRCTAQIREAADIAIATVLAGEAEPAQALSNATDIASRCSE
jgi:multiple sugar transport system substrate-binding protein